MGFGSPIHWLIVLAIVVLIFGTGKLKNLGKDLGASIKGFKKAMQDRRRCRPVHIEIPENADLSFYKNRIADMLRQFTHAGQRKRIWKIVFKCGR